MRYYYTNAQNQPIGPVAVEELQQLYATGAINTRTQVCAEGGQQWMPLSQVLGLTAAPPSPVGTGSAILQQVHRVSAWGAPTLDKLLGLVRRLMGEKELGSFFSRSESYGHMLLLLGAVLALLSVLIESIRTNNFLLLAAGFGGVLVLAVLQFAAQRFLAACASLVRNTPSQVGSFAVLECLALLLIVGAAFGLLSGLVVAVKTSALTPFIWGVVSAFLEFLLAAVCLSPGIAGVLQKESSAGQEAVGLVSFLLKAQLVLLPLVYLIFAVAGVLLTIVGTVGAPPPAISYGVMLVPALMGAASLIGLSVQIFGALIVVIVYFLFLLGYLWVDVIRAILGVPAKLDALRR